MTAPASGGMDGAAHAELVDRLRAGPVRVAALAGAAQSRRAGRRPAGWSEREIVAHLVRVDREVFQVRLRQLAREAEPRWAWVEPGAAPGHASLRSLLARFATVRAATIAQLAGLDEAGWSRRGTHATYGRLDVAGLLAIAIDHDEDHLAELARRT